MVSNRKYSAALACVTAPHRFKNGAAGIIGEASLDGVRTVMIPSLISKLNLLAVEWVRAGQGDARSAFNSVDGTFLTEDDFYSPGDFEARAIHAEDWVHTRPGHMAANVLHWAGTPTDISKNNPEAVEAFARVRDNAAKTFQKISESESEAATDLVRWREVEGGLGEIFLTEEPEPILVD